MRRLALLLLAACAPARDEAAQSEAAIAAQSAAITAPVGTLVQNGPSAVDQSAPAIAHGTDQYLAVWAENETIRAMRLDRDGKTLDDRSIDLPAGDGADESPAIAFDGTNYLVTWTHYGAGMKYVRYARVSASGAVLDQKPGELGRVLWATQPSVAWNGNEYLIAWSDGRDQAADSHFLSNVYGARISKDGVVNADPNGFAITADRDAAFKVPTVTAVGQTFTVAWTASTGVLAKRLDVDATPFVVDPSGTDVSIASDGASLYFATMHESGAIEVRRVRGLLVDPPLTLADHDGSAPAVAWSDGLVVAWGDNARRVDLVNGGITPIATTTKSVGRPAVADGSMILRLARRPEQIVVQTPSGTPVARGDATQRAPVAAFDGTRYLLVWEEVCTDWEHPEIWAAYSYGSTPAKPFRVGAGSQPSVAFDGTSFVAAWKVDDLHAATTTVRQNGYVADPKVFTASDAQIVTGGDTSLIVAGSLLLRASDPSMIVYSSNAPLHAVWDGSSFVIASQRAGGTIVETLHLLPDLHSVREPLSITGVPAGAPLSLASDGDGTMLLAWAKDAGAGILGRRFRGAAIIDPSPLDLDGAYGSKKVDAPVVAWDGLQWLTTYRTNADELELTRTPKSGQKSAALTIGAGSVTLAPGKRGDALIALQTNTPTPRVALRVFTDTEANDVIAPPPPAPTATPTPAPEPAPAATDEHGAPAFKKPSAFPKKDAPASTGAPTDDGCAIGPHQRRSPVGAVLVGLALVGSCLRRRRTRVPHASR